MNGRGEAKGPGPPGEAAGGAGAARPEVAGRRGVLDILEELNFAAAVVDAEARVVGLTGKVTELPDLGRCRVGEPPRHLDGAAEQRILRYIRAELSGRRQERPPLVVNGSRGKPLVVKALPIRRDGADPEAAVTLFFDLEASPAPSPEVLKHIFGFTRAEARLASRFAAGEGIAQLARSLGISVGTVRQHLKSIFAKTGCRRQGELLALLARLAALRLDGASLPLDDADGKTGRG